MQTLHRRTLLALGASALALAACKGGGGAAVSTEDMTMGDANAKVTVIEYASLACGHCAEWNKTVFPEFKAKYIDTGKVRYVFREFITPPPQLAVAGTLLARCAGKDKYFTVVDAIFHGQEEIFRTGDIRGVLLPIAQSAGLSEEAFMACVSDEKAINALNDKVQKYAKEAKIEGTPTFFFNDDKYGNGLTMAQIDEAYAKALAKVK
jgi:protein-disulfide isomerase